MRLLGFFCTVGFSTALAMSFYGLLFPLFAKQFGAGLFAIGALTSVLSLASFFASPAFGFLSDLFLKRKQFVFWSTIATGALLALNAAASSYEQLFFLALLIGVTTAASPVFLAMLSESVRKGFRLQFGFYSAANSAGAGIGIVTAGFLAEAYGFSFVFLASGLITIAAALFFQKIIPEAEYTQEDKKKVPIPHCVYGVYLASFLRQTAASGLWAIFPLYLLQFTKSLSELSLLYAANALLQPVFMFLISKTMNNTSRLALFTVGLVASLAGFGVYAIAADVFQVAIAQVIIALSWSCISLGANEYVLEKTAVKTHAETEGFLNSAFLLAGAVGAFIGGLLAEAYGFRTMILILSALMVAGIIVAIALLCKENPKAKKQVFITKTLS